MIRYLLICLMITCPVLLMATHNRAGELTYEHIEGYKYLFKIITYTYTPSQADRDELEIKITNEGSVIAGRVEKDILENTTFTKNTYLAEYTFSGPGIYEIVVEDPNRNLGVLNIPNSVNIPFSIKTIMLINPDLGHNDTPELLSPPIHKAALNRIFVHNPVTYDKQGDSLSFSFTSCTGERGKPIENYKLPEASISLTIDSATGEIVWNTPIDTGAYNIAIEVTEWRQGIAIGKITRDMQIEVFKTDNYPPNIDNLLDLCIFARDDASITFEVVDSEDDDITCFAEGGPFLIEDDPFVRVDTIKEFLVTVYDTLSTTNSFSINSSIVKNDTIVITDSLNIPDSKYYLDTFFIFKDWQQISGSFSYDTLIINDSLSVNASMYYIDSLFLYNYLTITDSSYFIDTTIIVTDSIHTVPVFKNIINRAGYSKNNLSWTPGCNAVREEAYNIAIIAEDNNWDVKLADTEQLSIKVLGPPPINVQTISSSNTVTVTWEKNFCSDVDFVIFRYTDSVGYLPDTCENGINESTGYIKVGEVDGSTNYFIDDNDGNGLIRGFKYCYIICAKHPNGTLSYPSEEVCAYLKPPVPNIIKTSVNTIHADNGSIHLAWLEPENLAEDGFNGPFKYKIYRSSNLWGMDAVLIDSISILSDTTYVDTLIDTENYPYSYLVELWNEEPGNFVLIGDNPGIASTLYADIEASDNKLLLGLVKNVPWVNYKYEIYRYNQLTDDLILIDSSFTNTFVDSNLTNGKEYCYRIKSFGNYVNDKENLYTTVNWSHINCGIPIDTIPPCPPELDVTKNCDSISNYLTWTYPFDCDPEVLRYYIYYTDKYDNPMVKIDSTNGSITSFNHKLDYTNAGCYIVTAIDSFYNESDSSIKVCMDICLNYELPNVFTPGNDGVNDILVPIEIDRAIEKVDMQIFNRWGQLVYQTDDPYINWNGLHYNSNKLVPPGVYYYICDVYAMGIMGLQPHNIVGFIHIFYEEKTLIIDE